VCCVSKGWFVNLVAVRINLLNSEEMLLPLFDGNVFPGVQKFIYVSVHDYNLPEFPLNI
jgi:hypothetical protein